MYGYSKDCLILILFRLPQISCFTLRLKCFSSDSDNCPSVGTDCSVPPPAKTKYSPTDTPVFPIVPLSFRVLHGSIYYFPLARYSCPLSAGVLHALLCLKVYSGCIHGERYTPRPSTPPPSCPHECTFINILSSPTNQPGRKQKHFSLWGS